MTATQEFPSVEYLERLYAVLQRLHRSLVVADAPQILEVVHETNALLSQPMGPDKGSAAENDLKRRQLIERIVELQSMNQTLCEGGLRMLQRLYELLGKAAAYDQSGKMDSHSSSNDVNVSA